MEGTPFAAFAAAVGFLAWRWIPGAPEPSAVPPEPSCNCHCQFEVAPYAPLAQLAGIVALVGSLCFLVGCCCGVAGSYVWRSWTGVPSRAEKRLALYR